MTSPGPAFQECTGSCHENVPAPKAVSSNLQSTDGWTVLAKIEIVVISVHNHPLDIDMYIYLQCKKQSLASNTTDF